MRGKGIRWWMMLLMLPLGSVFGSDGCVAEGLRIVADDLDEFAGSLDGEDDDLDLDDFLDELFEGV